MSKLIYRCDNPKCRDFFYEDDGNCPHCGSTQYHSFEWSKEKALKALKRVMKDLLS